MTKTPPGGDVDPWGEPDPKALEVSGRGLALDAMLNPPAPAPLPNRSLSVEKQVDRRVEAAKEKFQLGDFSGTLEVLSELTDVQQSRAEVQELKRKAEASLQAMVESKLGDLRRVPRVKVDAGGVLWLNLDAKSAFLLSQVDGIVSYEDLFMLSGMSRLDTARILLQLRDEGVIK